MFNPYKNYVAKVVVIDRDKECELCGEEMNDIKYYLYRGREICSRCDKELKGK